jgi:hypothetical protein
MTEVPHKGLLVLAGARLWHCRTGEVAALPHGGWELHFNDDGMGWLSHPEKEATLTHVAAEFWITRGMQPGFVCSFVYDEAVGFCIAA